nr:hypothetical protein [Mycolicibacterium malmesburyense]
MLPVDDDADTFELPGAPGKAITVRWAAGGHVLEARGGRGVENWLTRLDGFPDHLAKTERVLRALANRTDELPELRSDDAAISYVVSPRGLLPGPTAVPMRWFARPEGESHQLRVHPRLASWEKADHPDQVRLRGYLDDTEALLAASRVEGPWALRLDVGLSPERNLLDMADLDNYAYPLACRLRDDGLVSVWCTKQHSDQSFVRIEAAEEAPQPSSDVLVVRTSASWEKRAAQEQVYTAVAEATEIPAGPVRLELAFVVGPGRNWVNLWKQTIDSLEPLLGSTYPERAWHPLDGRITELGMHLTVDGDLQNDVQIGIAATPA